VPLIVGTSGSAWTYGAAILSFVFPMILFLAVITWLYVTYTKPSVVPGHREQTVARPIGFTPVVRMPGDQRSAARLAAASGPHYAFPAGPDPAGAAGGEAAGPENPGALPGETGAAE
jgi:hypothetical protein